MKQFELNTSDARPLRELFWKLEQPFCPHADEQYYAEKNPVWFQFYHMEFHGYYSVCSVELGTFMEVYGVHCGEALTETTHYYVQGVTFIPKQVVRHDDPLDLLHWQHEGRKFTLQTLRKHRRMGEPLYSGLSGVRAEALLKLRPGLTRQEALMAACLPF